MLEPEMLEPELERETDPERKMGRVRVRQPAGPPAPTHASIQALLPGPLPGVRTVAPSYQIARVLEKKGASRSRQRRAVPDLGR